MQLEEKFMQKVEMIPEAGCWLWTGAPNDKGYGRFCVDRKPVLAHRWSYSHFVRPIPGGMVVCHRCDTPACVNPSHLFVGSQADNVRDASRKKRIPHGENARFYGGILSSDVAARMRKARAEGESNRSIAERFGVSEGYASAVSRGIHWADVPSPDPIWNQRQRFAA